MKLKWGASTDVGMVRQQNEDSFLAEETLFVVADGMGGHNAGEVASALAVTTLKAGARLGIDDAEVFRELVQQANSAIYTASLDDSTQSGMGTTVTALSIVEGEEPRVLVANVGDSRAYLWRSGALSRLSVDHSYVQELVNEGIITPEAARVHPRRNIVTRALGIDRSVMVDVFTHFVRTGDRIVLCSDGLVDEVADTEIARVLGQHTDPQETAEALVMVANTNGGRDNTTVIVVDVLDDISEPIASSAPDNTAPMQSPSVDAVGVASSVILAEFTSTEPVPVALLYAFAAKEPHPKAPMPSCSCVKTSEPWYKGHTVPLPKVIDECVLSLKVPQSLAACTPVFSETTMSTDHSPILPKLALSFPLPLRAAPLAELA